MALQLIKLPNRIDLEYHALKKSRVSGFPTGREEVPAMVSYELLRAEGILIIRPEASLEAADFQRIALEVDS